MKLRQAKAVRFSHRADLSCRQGSSELKCDKHKEDLCHMNLKAMKSRTHLWKI